MLYNKLSKHLTISEYVNTLMKAVFNLDEVSYMNSDGVQLLVDVPSPLCSQYERPSMVTAVHSLLNRFNHCQPDESFGNPH